MLAQTTPARSRETMFRILLPFSVQTPALSPYGVLLAFSIASAGVRNVSTDSTGPKISSCAMRLDWLTLVNSVGRTNQPRAGRSQAGWYISAPSAWPASTSSSILASWAELLIAPTSVFLSSGSPTRSVDRRSFRRSMNGSAIDSWTNSRLPAQHTSPWLKKMPLTTPSIAWSTGASSKMMLAALPPSSSVSALSVPAMALPMVLPTTVEPVKATLSTSGCLTRARPISPGPVTMLTTPGGSSAWRQTSAKRRADSGVEEAGLRTTVLPAARAGAIFHASINSGKFHGMTCAATPSGRGSRAGKAYSSLSAQPA